MIDFTAESLACYKTIFTPLETCERFFGTSSSAFDRRTLLIPAFHLEPPKVPCESTHPDSSRVLFLSIVANLLTKAFIAFLLVLSSSSRIRIAGIRGIQGVVRKTVNDELQAIIWEPQHMDKIVPSLLFNMHKTEDDDRYLHLSSLNHRQICQPIPAFDICSQMREVWFSCCYSPCRTTFTRTSLLGH